jgi:adenosylcobyric acid synthase
MVKIIQVLGTASDSGKSTLVMALCNYFAQKGYKVAPFKAVNMSLNSISLKDSSEISRAQWLQATASGTDPSKYMNPFLVKPEGMGRSQIIVRGKPIGSLKVEEYYEYLKNHADSIIKESLAILSSQYDIIIAEGAGSAAEINMEDRDFSNSYVSSIYETPAILIADIDKGGVFASIYGTIKLMKHGDLVKYIVINRMRGDSGMLHSGISKLEELTGKKVIGIIPYSNISLPGEDSLNYYKPSVQNSKICVIRYPHMENYSDFDPFYLFNIGFTFVDKNNIGAMDNCDVIILPGSKLVTEDLHYMEKHGIASKLIALQNSKTIIGICGGYQILGKKIIDVNSVQSKEKETKCLGILDLETEYMDQKESGSVNYKLNEKIFGDKYPGEGYEIHYGKINGNTEEPLAYINGRPDGSVNRNIYGTNIHGMFENKKFLKHILGMEVDDYKNELRRNIKSASKLFTDNLDMELIESMVL